MTKYLYKGMKGNECDRFFARQKVLKSQNLDKPDIAIIGDDDNLDFAFSTIFASDSLAQYCNIKKSHMAQRKVQRSGVKGPVKRSKEFVRTG